MYVSEVAQTSTASAQSFSGTAPVCTVSFQTSVRCVRTLGGLRQIPSYFFEEQYVICMGKPWKTNGEYMLIIWCSWFPRFCFVKHTSIKWCLRILSRKTIGHGKSPVVTMLVSVLKNMSNLDDWYPKHGWFIMVYNGTWLRKLLYDSVRSEVIQQGVFHIHVVSVVWITNKSDYVHSIRCNATTTPTCFLNNVLSEEQKQTAFLM